MVEIAGERVLAASCIRRPAPGMKVVDRTRPAPRSARAMVIELLLADSPRATTAHDPDSKFWRWAERVGVDVEPVPRPARRPRPTAATRRWPSTSTPASSAASASAPAARSRSTTSSAWPTAATHAKVVFDFDDPMGAEHLRRLRRVRPGLPDRRPDARVACSTTRGRKAHEADREVDSLCPYCGVGCQVTFQIEANRILHVDGRDGPANHNRLCVKGRFGFDYVHHPHRLTTPLIRKPGVPKDADDQVDPAEPVHPLPRGDLGRGPRRRRRRAWRGSATRTAAGPWPGSARRRGRTRRRTCSRSWSGPGSAATTSTTAPGSATPRRSPPCWRRSARGRSRPRSPSARTPT